MAAPLFVTAGTVGNQGFGTSLGSGQGLGLPASRVNGNLLICHVVNDGIATVTFSTATSGWVGPFASQTSSGVNTALFYYIVDGSEAVPSITWTGNRSVAARIYQYNGQRAGFTGSNKHNTVTTGTTVTESGVTTTGPNSMIAVFVGGCNIGTTVGAATNYTTDSGAAGSNATLAAFSQTKATTGSASDSFSSTVGNAGANPGWNAWSIEIRSLDNDIIVPNDAGVTMAAALDRLVDVISTHGLGVAMEAEILSAVEVTPSVHEQGFDVTVVVTPELSVSAAHSLGLSMAAAVVAIFTLPLTNEAVGFQVATTVITGEKPPQPTLIIGS